MPALDGLRALAVMAVIVYHADAAWLPGGYLGVEVFFAISGYLITALLITEFDRTDRIDFVDFWKRRAKRLLPALGVLLIGVALLAMFTARDALGSLWGQSVAASTYVMNWSLIATEQSYFESFGRPPLLQHLWSLAIEEQFYLLMPTLFLAGRRLLGRRITLGVVLAGIVASVALMWTGFDPTVDPSRLYYGTDTRAAGILVGVAMAMVWRPWVAGGPLTERLRASAWPDIAGVVGLLVIGHQLWTLGAYDARLYRGGFLLIAIATVAVVAAVANPGSLVAVPLSAKPLRWIGQRSYGLYLWHWPVFMVLRPGVDTIVSEPWLTVLLEMPEVDPGPDDAVVIHLGNNGAVTTDTLDAVLERFADAGRVVLVTVRVPRPWESQVNRALSGATGRYPNTVLADWQGASDGTPNWFGGDGVHLTQSGAKALRDTIAYALCVD